MAGCHIQIDLKTFFKFQLVASIILLFGQKILFDYIDYIGMFSICGVVGLLGLTAVYFFKPKLDNETYGPI